MSKHSSDPKKQGRLARLNASRKQALSEARAQRERTESNNRKWYGDSVIRKGFGGTVVEIYSGGYVRVGFGTTFEQLRSIKFTGYVQDQSPGGRAIMAGLSLGLSTLTSPQDRNLSLAIATDRKVHTLTEAGASPATEKAGMALEAAGQAVLAAPTTAQTYVAPPPTVWKSPQVLREQEEARRAEEANRAESAAGTEADLADQIRKLAELHADGILTDAEFLAKKKDLLDRM